MMRILGVLVLAFVLLGIFAGLVPGLHPNSIAAIILEIYDDPQMIGIGLVLMLGAYTAIAFIPAIFMGIPEGQTQVALLPGQRMLKEGRGLEAAYVCAVSVVFATVISMILSPLLVPMVKPIYFFLKPYLGYILLIAVLFLLKNERGSKKILLSLFLFTISAFFGFIVLESDIIDPLFPMFVGFFSIPALISTANDREEGVVEKCVDTKIDFLIPIMLGVLMGAIADFLPGISTPAQLAVFSTLIIKLENSEKFLAHIASIEASHAVFAMVTAASAGFARVGTIAMVLENSSVDLGSLPIYFAAFLFSISIGAFLLLRISKSISTQIKKVDLGLISKIVAIYLVFVIFIKGGLFSLLILIIATVIGYVPRVLKISRTHLMGSLIGPSIAHFFIV